MQIDLSSKIAVITGASGQLGRTMARTLAGCGADIAIHFHENGEQAELLRREIVAMGVRAMTVQADVTEPESVIAMRDAIVATLGDPQIVVTNAVIQYAWTTVLEQAVEDYDSQFRSCVLQNVLMAKAFVPAI